MPPGWRARRHTHNVVVLVGSVNKGVLQALAYARSLAPDRLIAVCVVTNQEEQDSIQKQWAEHEISVELHTLHSAYRELTRPVLRYLDELDSESQDDIITVIIPEFVVTPLVHERAAQPERARPEGPPALPAQHGRHVGARHRRLTKPDPVPIRGAPRGRDRVGARCTRRSSGSSSDGRSRRPMSTISGFPKSSRWRSSASDAISSTAYATEEILLVLVPVAAMAALEDLVPIAIVVVILLAIVTTSYRQTLFAYPSGGGSYIVSKDNLGVTPALVAGASLLVDYVLTVAVSVSAGVAAITSAFPSTQDIRVPMCLGFIALMTVANLRGVKESGRLFAGPTYLYVLALSALIIYGLYQSYFGGLEPLPVNEESLNELTENGSLITGITLFALLRAFSSGAVALSGVEAISNGVPAFRPPEPRNAARTLIWMSCILGATFFGISVLAHRLQPTVSEHETLLSIMGGAVFGDGTFFYYVLQFSTFAILILAANTAYADFPRLVVDHREGRLPPASAQEPRRPARVLERHPRPRRGRGPAGRHLRR